MINLPLLQSLSLVCLHVSASGALRYPLNVYMMISRLQKLGELSPLKVV